MSAPKPKKCKYSAEVHSYTEILQNLGTDIFIYVLGLLSIPDTCCIMTTSKRISTIAVQSLKNRTRVVIEFENSHNILAVIRKYCRKLEELKSWWGFGDDGGEILSRNNRLTTLAGQECLSIPNFTSLTNLTDLSTTVQSNLDTSLLRQFQHLSVLSMASLPRRRLVVSIDDICTDSSASCLELCQMKFVVSPTRTFSHISVLGAVNCGISNENCLLFARYLPNLEILMLRMEEHVTDVGVAHFAYSKKLRAISLICTAVTENLLAKVMKVEGRFLQLLLLKVSFEWDRLSDDGRAFEKVHPYCRVRHSISNNWPLVPDE